MQEPHLSELIERARRGNPEAAASLYEQYHPAIFRYLYYRLAERGAAEDLTGDVFLKMLQALRSFQGSPAAFRGWLFQIARNLSIDHLRRALAHPTQSVSEELRASDVSPEFAVEGGLTSVRLNAALAGLSDDQKDVILLRFVSQLPLAETAQTLHKSEDAVKGLQRRALLALREVLQEKE
jgi:RNA polymerase sigma-70 factor, ECF subfamily